MAKAAIAHDLRPSSYVIPQLCIHFRGHVDLIALVLLPLPLLLLSQLLSRQKTKTFIVVNLGMFAQLHKLLYAQFFSRYPQNP